MKLLNELFPKEMYKGDAGGVRGGSSGRAIKDSNGETIGHVVATGFRGSYTVEYYGGSPRIEQSVRGDWYRAGALTTMVTRHGESEVPSADVLRFMKDQERELGVLRNGVRTAKTDAEWDNFVRNTRRVAERANNFSVFAQNRGKLMDSKYDGIDVLTGKKFKKGSKIYYSRSAGGSGYTTLAVTLDKYLPRR